MKIELLPKAEKQLAAIDRVWSVRIRQKLLAYAASPSSLANQVKKRKGLDSLRLRVGDYRVIFEQEGDVLRIMKVGHRREIYD